MSKSFDINIREIEKVPLRDLEYSSLTLQFDGKTVDHILINTLRRAIINNVPTHAFPAEGIIIEKNTSVFNNDQMRARLSQLPILNTSLDLEYLQDKYWNNIDYARKDRAVHKKEKNIELYVSAVNNDKKNIDITTNDIKYYEDNEQTKNKYNQKYPIVLIRLRPGDEFKCKMKAMLGIGERNAIWMAGFAYHEVVSDKILLHIESMGQFDEYEILWKACWSMIKKMSELKKIITETYKETNVPMRKIDMAIDNETHTIAGLLVEKLQDRDDIEYAGYGKRNELVKQVSIFVTYKKEISNPLDPIMETIDYINELMEFIADKVFALGKKYINSPSKDKKTKK